MEEKNESASSNRDQQSVFSEEDFKKLFRLEEKEQVFQEPPKKWWESPAKPIVIKKKKTPPTFSSFWSELDRGFHQFKLTDSVSLKVLQPFKWIIFIFVLLIILIWPTLFLRLSFWYRTDFQDLPFKTFSEAELKQQIEANSALGRATIYIPKIGVLTPLFFDISKEFSKELTKNGLVQLSGSVKPTEAGQAIILGKGSRFIFELSKSKYSLILLDQLVVGDELYFLEEDKNIKYKVNQVGTELRYRSFKFPETTSSELILVSELPIAFWRQIYVSFTLAD